MNIEFNYNSQAAEFLNKTDTTLNLKFEKYGKYFDDDKEPRLIYRFTFKRGNRQYSALFGESVAETRKALTGQEYKIGYTIHEQEEFEAAANSINPDGSFKFKGRNPRWLPLPSAYSILACLTKCNPGSFENFCSEYGYDTDSKKAEKTYQAVKNEYLSLAALFNESEMEQLAEIQ